MKIERVHLGKIIQEKMEERGLIKAQFAKLIGIKRQNIDKTVFEKESLDTNMLCKISEVLDCNFFYYFMIDKKNTQTDIKATVTIEMVKEKKDKTFIFRFGENDVVIPNI